jgi:hypothetical protein
MMSVLYKQICNGCGRWNEEGKGIYSRISVDLTNYVLFSSGFKLREGKIDIHFCNDCYSEVLEETMYYGTGEEIDRLKNKITEKNKKIENIERDYARYKGVISGLLRPITTTADT